MINAMGKFFKNYFNFKGRTRRKDFWLTILGLVLVSVIIELLAKVTGNWAVTEVIEGTGVTVGQPTGIFATLANIWSIGTLIPNIALDFRRLHDTDKRAWFLLWLIVPLLGPIIILIRYLKGGDAGTNRFGADPKQEAIEG